MESGPVLPFSYPCPPVIFCKQKDKEPLKSKTPLSIRKEYTRCKNKKQEKTEIYFEKFVFSENDQMALTRKKYEGIIQHNSKGAMVMP
jgi:hypothetical protein